jgi:hypothetical protein
MTTVWDSLEYSLRMQGLVNPAPGLVSQALQTHFLQLWRTHGWPLVHMVGVAQAAGRLWDFFSPTEYK